MRILSLDLGEKSLGVCISDQTNTIPVPLGNYFFNKNDFKNALKIVLDILNEYPKINKILLGYPIKTTGEKSPFTLKVEDFYLLLKKNIDDRIKVILYDERFSTKRALDLIKNNKKEDQKKLKDVISAFLILEDYLENKN